MINIYIVIQESDKIQVTITILGKFSDTMQSVFDVATFAAHKI